MKGAEAEGRIFVIKATRASLIVLHLLFAENNLLLCKADVKKCAELMKIINGYCLISGQQLNPYKSSIPFGRKIPLEEKNSIN